MACLGAPGTGHSLSTSLQHDAPQCLYAATAGTSAPLAPLTTDARTEVAVVGAGYTGLSTALHLAERGTAVVLLEAHEPGWGAAGRNGGQVNAGLKHEPDEVERHFGETYGPRLVQFAGGAPAYLFELVDRLGIQCEARREGTIRAARQASHAAALQASVEQWRRRGAALEHWNAEQVAAATGTHRYAAATFDPRGGSVNPLALARGLAVAAIATGAQLYGDSRALRLEQARSGWRIETPKGSVRADKVVLATDGYTDALWPGLRTSIIPLYSSIIASEPLPENLAAAILPGGGVVYESGEITTYYRLDRDRRLLMGGRGVQRRAISVAEYQHLVHVAHRLWPALATVSWTHWWNGQFALTSDFYPRLHNPDPNLLIALGYSGRGVAFATALGSQLAAACTGADFSSLALPVTPISQIPFHWLWRVAVAARVAYGTMLDGLGGGH